MWLSLLVFLLALPAVSIEVTPKVAITNSYKMATFKLTWRIQPHKGNQFYSLYYTCGKETHSSLHQLEGDNDFITRERYVELTVTSDCYFRACVHRAEDKPKNYCADTEIFVEDPP